MSAYIPFDYENFRAVRKLAILARLAPVPAGYCHMCGWPVPGELLWCSKICARDYLAEALAISEKQAGLQ